MTMTITAPVPWQMADKLSATVYYTRFSPDLRLQINLKDIHFLADTDVMPLIRHLHLVAFLDN